MKNIALIGCGRISKNHIEAFSKKSKQVKLIACCDPKTERARGRADEYLRTVAAVGNEVLVFDDYRKMLNTIRPDAVSIATESGRHAAIAIDCLDAGCHVLCEKPMALSIADADEMIAAADRNRRILSVCFQNRFNPPVQRARAAYEAGRFGRMLHGSVQVRWNRNERYYAEAPWRGTWALDGGTLMNQCTHGIDLLQWMMGEDVVRVQGVTRRFCRPIEAEDFGSAILEFSSGAVGIIEGSADIYPTNLDETLSLFGEKGSVVIGGLAVNKILTWRFADSAEVGDTEGVVLDPRAEDPPNVYGFGHAALLSDFLSAIEGNRAPLISGRKGKKALEIILAIYKSMKEGRPVNLPIEFKTTDMSGIF